MAGDGSLSVVIPTYQPDATNLVRTIDSIGDQDYPVEEVVIVNSGPDPLEVNSQKVRTRVIESPETGTGEARREGMESVDTEYVAHFDEDAVLLREDYFSDAVERLQKPDVSAVGGTVFPLRGNVGGRAIALADRFNPSSLGTHHIVHRRALCTEGECFYPGQGRGEDISIRRELQQHGHIERMQGQGALKDLPTARQGLARDLIVGTVTGAIAGAVSGYIRDQVSDVGSALVSEVDEDLGG